MVKRIGLALATITLLLPLQVSAQKSGRSSSHSSRSYVCASASLKTLWLPDE